ncbi:MAG: VOC family protein [Candidatus Eisenbacteria bacterium]|uniref:VOC family protein n=1 Tax=Eiseniibacteriota bacterium TaxID=2212470 RepID=A0A849SHM0_UNCEI|nr:VOC family protein [Candidatus Eisenbacteria bacterium]
MTAPATRPAIGTIGWIDLTVEDATRLRDFYREVVGWSPEDVKMGEYADYNMRQPASLEPAVGMCHHRGVNVGVPPQWMIYINIEDLDRSMAQTRALGGEVLHGPRAMGPNLRFCVIRDPAGAVCGLMETKA